MMKLTDFRIGNLILLKHSPHEPLAIAEILRDSVHIAPRREAPWLRIPIEYVEGIEITEEWLKKLGFIEETEKWFTLQGTTFKSTKIVFMDNKVQRIEVGGANIFSCERIKFVHQIQNIIFDLTGLEITTLL